MQVTHEEVSMHFMEELNEAYAGRLSLALSIFRDEYPKRFLHQLVSGQLDMDRMDYLNRDSFFTGVHEGVIGYDRIIKMLSVRDGELVVEEKGIYSIEKFLIARRIMYWQVYLHKTVLSAERMLIAALQRAQDLSREGVVLPASPALSFFLHESPRRRISGASVRRYCSGLRSWTTLILYPLSNSGKQRKTACWPTCPQALSTVVCTAWSSATSRTARRIWKRLSRAFCTGAG